LITEATRTKVLHAAEAAGYRPDPEVAKTMRRLRAGLGPAYKSTIYGITTRAEKDFLEYHSDVIRGAKQRAEELGYGFILKHLDPLSANQRRLQRTLIHQNVEGLLLLPMANPCCCDDWLEWGRFSVVSATYGVRSPAFHRVIPHQFNNLRVACAELAALGYRRIGLVVSMDQSVVVNHSFVAALGTQNILGATEPVTPLLYSGDFLNSLLPWFDRERPDALIFDGEATYDSVASVLGEKRTMNLGIALANRERKSRLAGIDEQGSVVGRTAVELLAFKIQTGEKGVPAQAQVTMIEGTWITGAIKSGLRRS